MYNAMVVKLGDAGKWHCVRTYGSTAYYTAYSLTLRDVVSSVMTIRVERKNGDPTCKHCIRWCRQHGYNV